MAKKVVGYVRVSSNFQATEGVSLDAQREAIARWCVANDAALDEGDVFVEGQGADGKSRRGKSGGRADNRPGLQAALDRVCQSGGILVVYSLSRLARSTKDTMTIAERLDKAGADLVSLSEKIDTTSASGKMVFRLLAVLAEFERDLVSERTLAALAHKRARGERTGQVPYGKSLAPDGRTLVDDPAGLEVIATVRRLRAEGWSLRRIAEDLTSRGVPTMKGGPTWSFGSIRHLIQPRRHRRAKG